MCMIFIHVTRFCVLIWHEKQRMTELDGCKVTAGSDGSLEITAQFLGCDKMELNAALVSRMMQTPLGGRRGSSIMYVVVFFL